MQRGFEYPPERPRASQTRRLPASPYVSPASADTALGAEAASQSSETKEESSPSADSAVLQGTHTALLPHTHPDCHVPPPPTHRLPFPRQLPSEHGAPRAPTASVSKQTSSMNLASSRWPRSCSTGPWEIRWNLCRRSAESRTCHARQRLDGNRATQRH